MLSQEIRRGFLQYFKNKKHTVVPSSPVVPHDDPTLLFTNAGMNQFKDLFLGKSKRDYTRAASSQKCLRVGGKHNDLDNVGHTSRHLTFFEMLGNFSFGDYFKKEAIAYGFEVSTEIFRFPIEKLWVTIFETDDEAYELWKEWVDPSRIVRLGEKDNFWSMGETGPCGPCSEIYFDRGEKYGSAPSPKEDATGERYLEFWNLVFMQYNRDSQGVLTPLPKQSIDTGSGLERVISLKMGVDSLFGTDIFVELIAQIEKVSGKKYQHGNPAFHVIADHIRSLSFAIADGVQPSNLDRGYVLRKLLRRAVRYGKSLGFEEPFLAKVLPRLVDIMGADYPELLTSQKRIEEILTLEEEAFFRTLKRGGNILQSVIEKAVARSPKQISGEEAFTLKDTYGFPLEEILLIAKDMAVEVNLESYQLLEEKAKELSRQSQQVHLQQVEQSLFQEYVEKSGGTAFVGYEEASCSATVKALLANGVFVPRLKEGEEGWIILDKTPFYAEKGGQIGDSGTISSATTSFAVSNCQTPFPELSVHIGKVERGEIKTGDSVTASIDTERRANIERHHTATHLLHWALQEVLGPHIRQAGSLVEPNRLRFDFNHHKPLAEEELYKIEDLVNRRIREGRSVSTYELRFDEVQKKPQIKQFFGDKYGSLVRVVDIDYSQELCGGTHVKNVGSIGYFRIAKEASIAAGVRRIEAVAGEAAEHFVREEERKVKQTAQLLKTDPHRLQEKVSSLLEENRALSKECKTLKTAHLEQLARSLLEKKGQTASLTFLVAQVDLPISELAALAAQLSSKEKSLALLLATKDEKSCHVLAKISPDLVAKGLSAMRLIQEISPLIEASGGGKELLAQAGGKKPEALDAALKRVQEHFLQFSPGA